jgi:methylamine dehydrogenase light chain
MKLLDLLFERSARRVADVTSRRQALSRLGSWLVAGAALPLLLPIDRAAKAHAGETGIPGDPGDPNAISCSRFKCNRST